MVISQVTIAQTIFLDWDNATVIDSVHYGGKYNVTILTRQEPNAGQTLKQIVYTKDNVTIKNDFVDYLSDTYAYILNSTPENTTVLCWWDYGHSIEGITGRDVVIADPSREMAPMVGWSQFLSGQALEDRINKDCTGSQERIADVAKLLTTMNTGEAVDIMHKYNATYLFVPKEDAGKSGAMFYALNEPRVDPDSYDFGLLIIGKAVKGDYITGFRLVYSDRYGSLYQLDPMVPLEQAVPPVAAVAVGAGAVAAVPLIDRLLAFLFGGAKSYAQKNFGALEARVRRLQARARKPLFLGISAAEFGIALATALLLGLAFIYSGKLSLSLYNVGFFFIVAGLAAVLHELAHLYVAKRYGARAEFRLWGVGIVAMFMTALLAGTVFGQPARLLVTGGETLNKRDRAIVWLAGPGVSLAVAALFLLLVPLGFAAAGITGMTINLLLFVYSLIPLNPMDGERVYGWNRAVWAVAFVPLLLVYVGLMVFVL